MPPASLLLGATLDAVAGTDFFRWFHLERQLGASEGQIEFRPSGAAFRDLVAMTIHRDARGIVAAAEIRIARSFIDDPDQGMNAADFAASFLSAALPSRELAGIQHLVDTLRHHWRYARPRIVAAGQPAPEIHLDSAPYLVWLGRNPHWTQPESATGLRLEATGSDVRITVGLDSARPTP
ncbi:MAG: hypothetical protein JNM30_15395 [Rhodospirillales bacterium]|nr:hypothetical protein [Rhodospirillales bacterium]